jgi:hypothetical protein
MAEDEAAARKKADTEAAAKKKTEEEAAAKQRAEEEAAAKEKAEGVAAARKKAGEEAAAKKTAEEEATEVFPTAHPLLRGFFSPALASIAAEVLQHGHRTGQQPRSSASEGNRQNTTLLHSRPTPTQLAVALCVAQERCEVAEAEAVLLRAEIVALRACKPANPQNPHSRLSRWRSFHINITKP